jgi:hypothetical protein
MSVADAGPVGERLTADQGMGLLVDLLKRLFVHKIPVMKETPVMRRFEKDMFEALNQLEREPGGSVERLPLGVQRFAYEMITQYAMMYAQSPGLSLAVPILPNMSGEERLSCLLRQEIIRRSWPYPQSVPL